eukprot:jgi/Tetstr1/424386/TSEL_014945.t1
MSDVKIFKYPLDQTLSKCEKLWEGSPLKVGAGWDGSEVAKRAMKHIKRLVNVERGYTLFGLHVEDVKKHSDHPIMKPDFLSRQFEREAYDPLGKVGGKHLSWCLKKKTEEHSTYTDLTALALEKEVDVLVVGNIGHTQSKTTNGEHKELGHIAEHVWRLCKTHVCLVKSSSYPIDLKRQATWLISVDGSHASMMAFCTVVLRFIRANDEVIVQYFGTSDEICTDEKKVMLEDYRDALKTRKIEGRAEGIVVENGGIASGILEQCSKVQADFLVLGIAGFKQEKLGSVSQEVLGAARCSVLAIKDQLDATASSGA